MSCGMCHLVNKRGVVLFTILIDFFWRITDLKLVFARNYNQVLALVVKSTRVLLVIFHRADPGLGSQHLVDSGITVHTFIVLDFFGLKLGKQDIVFLLIHLFQIGLVNIPLFKDFKIRNNLIFFIPLFFWEAVVFLQSGFLAVFTIVNTESPLENRYTLLTFLRMSSQISDLFMGKIDRNLIVLFHCVKLTQKSITASIHSSCNILR